MNIYRNGNTAMFLACHSFQLYVWPVCSVLIYQYNDQTYLPAILYSNPCDTKIQNELS